MAVINELITELGFNLKDGTTRKIDEFEGKINGLTESFEKIGKTVTGGLGIKDFFMNALSGSQDLMNMSKAYRISTDALQEWKYAAEVSGVSAENLMTDLYHLRKDFFMNEKAVLNLADRFKSMNEAQALWEGQDLYGLSIDTILTLRRGAKELREEFNRAPKTPKEILQNAEKLNRELIRQKANMRKIAETIALEVTPKFNNWMEKFNNWLGESPGRTEMLVQGVGGALALLTGSEIVGGISKFAGAIGPLIEALGGLRGILIGGALATAIYGLYKSFQAFQNGEETLIPWENIIKDFEIAADKVAETLDGIKEKWYQFKEWLKSEEGTSVMKEEKELITGSIDYALRITETGGALIGSAVEASNRPGPFFPNYVASLQRTLPEIWEGAPGTTSKEELEKERHERARRRNLADFNAYTNNLLGTWDFMGIEISKPNKAMQNMARLSSIANILASDTKTFNPYQLEGLKNLPNQSIAKEVEIGSKSLNRLSQKLSDASITKNEGNNTFAQGGGAPNFSGSMITIFTAETMQEAVQYLEDNGAMGAIEDMSGYQESDFE